MTDNPWEGQTAKVAYEFGQECLKLHKINPYSESTLEVIMMNLMTELWDNGFSQSEIRSAFQKAVADLPRYAAGEERRGEGKR